jgi:hypothetical protein
VGTILLEVGRAARRQLGDRPPGARVFRVLAALLALDGLVVLLHVAHKTTDRLAHDAFGIDTEWGLAERIQYGKEGAIALLLGRLAVRARSGLLATWSLLFVYVLLDDALMLHETLGLALEAALGVPSMLGMPGNAWAEVLVFGAVGVVFLAALALAARTAGPEERRRSALLLIMLGALALCGVVGDAAHALGAELRAPRVVNGLLGIVEDGGEHVAMSGILWFALVSLRSAPAHPPGPPRAPRPGPSGPDGGRAPAPPGISVRLAPRSGSAGNPGRRPGVPPLSLCPWPPHAVPSRRWLMKRPAVLPLMLALAALGCSRGDDQTVSGPTGQRLGQAPATNASGRNFTAHLSGDDEVPARDTRATGQAVFHFRGGGGRLEHKLIVANIENVVAAHIHCGAPGVNGPVGVTLFSAPPAGGRVNGPLAQGTLVAPDPGNACGWADLAAVLGAIQAGNAYVNVHTNDGVEPTDTGPGDFPGGEVRGQIR